MAQDFPSIAVSLVHSRKQNASMGGCLKLGIQIGLCRFIRWINITDVVRGQSWCNHKAGSANIGMGTMQNIPQ